MTFDEYTRKILRKEDAAGKSFDEYTDFKLGRSTNVSPAKDIAPVAQPTPTKQEDDDKWFKSGLFDDGYQFGDVLGTILGTAGDVATGVVQGVGNLAEGVVDLGMYGVAAGADFLGAKDFAKATKENAKFRAVDSVADSLRDATGLENASVLGDKSDGISQGLGQVAGIILTGGIGGAAGLGSAGVGALTMGVTGASSFGSGIGEAYEGGATDAEAWAYGGIKGGVDAVTEMIFGGLGKTVKALGVSKGLSSLDDMFARKLSSKISNQFASNLVELGVKATAEGLEELGAGFGTALAKWGTYKSEEDFWKLLEDENLLEQFISGAVVSGIAQSPDIVKATKGKRSLVTNTNKNEDTVINKEFENRVAEAEKDGKKLSNSEKNKLYDKVIADMDKGYISIDTIEETLGGDDYKAYKDNLDAEKSLVEKAKAAKTEFDELNKLKTGDRTGEQTDRLEELRGQLKDYKTQINDMRNDPKRGQLKETLSKNVEALAKDSRFYASYVERANRGKAFAMDEKKLKSYDEKQRKVIQNAIDSGILNNTNRTHDFVDMVAKTSADSGVSFNFTNNENLKNSGFAVDGKVVNGFVTKDGVTVNIDSHKALNTVVGHEITHVLEGTDLYKNLQSAVFEYAKTKKDFDERRATLTELYKDVKDANIDGELTADLVGDYLFTDADFIKNLSVKHRNVFRKVYDQVKHLLKLATSGSREERELEKVKWEFEKVYREQGKNAKNTATDTKYSFGYHAGDLGKAESLGNQSGGRDTGHFGTGTYFVGDEKEISDSTYGNRPHEKVDFDKYNLFQPKTAENAQKLHDFLKGVNYYYDRDTSLVSTDEEIEGIKEMVDELAYDELTSESLEQVINLVSKVAGKYKTNDALWSFLGDVSQGGDGTFYNGDTPMSLREVAETIKDKDAAAYKLQQLLDDGYVLRPIWRYQEWNESVVDAADMLGLSEDQARQIISNIKAEIDAAGYDYKTSYTADSASTRFMKALGYEGVDVRGIKQFDNTMYGSVIYDLKGEDAKRKAEIGTAKYSLTAEQQEYFKDSKIKDKNGNLIPLYHGTMSDFTEFDIGMSGDNYDGWSELGKGIYLTPDKKMAQYYADNVGRGRDTRIMELFANVKNPFNVLKSVEFDISDIKQKYDLTDFDEAFIKKAGYRLVDFLKTHKEDVRSYLTGKGYDGVWDMGESGELDQVVVYNSNQVKNIDNTKPTENPDIRYSLSTDSDGKKLTNEQSEFFKDSKMRDDDGNLKVMYHGSQDAGFHTFDAKFSDDDTSFFFVDRNDVAASYSGTTETYEARTIRTVEDMNNFLAEIGEEDYKVVEKNGKFTLLQENEKVADSDTAQGIYEEFCDWVGVGYGDANYKVYLNLKNPLVVDAEGRNWNNVTREYSQEIADRYNSLTADEKAVLHDLSQWGDYSTFKDEMLDARALAERGEAGVFDEEYTKNLASAYEKLGGANANLYDAFSVASYNFPEEIIKEFAFKNMNTRDYAQKAKADGYDGVIFKNIVDNGGYSNGSEGASTVAIAFYSNQIKSVANEKPTGDPDIRYSLSEYTAEEKKAHNDAVLEHFGKTYKWDETGYLLLDGTKLDLSGKHDGAPGGYRTVDHRDITEALGYDYGGGDYSGSLIQFMSEGNIRIVPEINGINLSVKPTKAQERALSDYISRYRGEVLLDIDDLNGNTVVSVEYPHGTYYTKVLNDIREWFDNGKRPETSGVPMFRSLTKEGDIPKRFGNYAVYGDDVRLDAPTKEDIAPVKETVSKKPNVPMTDIAPSEPTSFELRNQQAELNKQIEDAYNRGDSKAVESLMTQYSELARKADQMEADENARQKESLESLDDADAPPEAEAPYYGESEDIAPENPFDNRDIKAVGSQKVKAYMYENPEVKPFFQQEARYLLGELSRSQKGERLYIPEGLPGSYGAESYGHYVGVKRQTSPDIEYLLDTLKFSYDDIKNALNAIIEDNGAENNAKSKRIEFILNDRLMNGSVDESGFESPANQDYINLLNEKQITEYNDEARKSFFDVADDYIPKNDDIAPVVESKQYEAIKPKQTKEPKLIRVKDSEDIAPYETRKSAQIDGQTTMFPEGKIAEVYDTEPESGKKKSRGWSQFKTNFLDKGAVFEDLYLKTKNRELMGKWNHTLSSEARAQRMIGKGMEGVKSLNDIRAEVESTGLTKQFYEYMYHKHNVDRMSLESQAKPVVDTLRRKFGNLKIAQVRAIAAKKITDKTTEKTANTIREAKEYLNAVETKNKPVFGFDVTAEKSREIVNQYERTSPNFKEYAKDVYDYMNYLRNQMVKSGVISQETADLWSKMYPHYVPIRRLGDSGLAVNVPLDTGRTGINAPIKKATGGNKDILPLFDTMALRTEQTFRAMARNNFGVELKNTLGTTVESNSTNIDEVIDSIDNHEGLLKKGENGGKPTFTVFEDGKKVTFEITEDMYDALKPTSDGLKYTNKIASTVGNLHKGILTEYNPVFMATNAIKDAQDVLINSQHPAKTYANMPNAILQIARNGKWYQEYLENGGEQNTYFDGQNNTFKAEDKGIKKLIGMPLRAISRANNFIERVPRLAEYIASRKKGASIEVAMLDAARVTTNFAAGGDVTKFLNRNGATFLNASVQGFNQQVRNLREAKANGLKGWVQLAAKVAVAGIPVMILNKLLWEDDEEYEELSDYVKDNYYVVAKMGDGQFVRIPKGRTLAVIQNALEQTMNAATGDDEADLESFLELAISNLAPNNPIDNNILSPIMQVANNKTWYGEDLVPTRLQDLPKAEQFDESTDALSKWLGEKQDWLSPYQINYLLDQYSGGIGDVFLPIMTPEAESGDNSTVGNLIAPFKDKFTTDSVMNNQNVSDFYDTVDELTKNAKSSYATDEDVLKYKYMNSVNAELSDLYAKKREIQNSDLSDAEKYEAVREIQKQIDTMTEDALNTYGNVTINGKYASVGDQHYRWYEPGEDSESEPGWQKISDKQLEKQEEVTSGLGISPSEYWSNKTEYDFAYEYPGKYAVAKSVGGYESYKTYSSELYDIKADKDENGKSISGSRKEKVIDYINNLDADYGEKIILFKSEYNADDTYNYEIIDYLNSRDDISYEEMESILKELGFTVTSDGDIYW